MKPLRQWHLDVFTDDEFSELCAAFLAGGTLGVGNNGRVCVHDSPELVQIGGVRVRSSVP